MPDPFNSMQANAGLFPQSPFPTPAVMYPGQVAAMVAAQGNAMLNGGGMFPTNTFTPGFGANPLFQGPTGFITPMGAGAPFNPYAPSNPFANLAPYGGGRPSPFSPPPPGPPPAYAGLQGLQAAPYAPPPIASPFDTPYGNSVAQAHAAHMRSWSMGQAAMGGVARVGTTLGAAAIGGAFGGPIGAVGGALFAEGSGISRSAQNLYGNYVAAPRLAIHGATQAFEHLSQGFIQSGPGLHASGSGFSHQAAHEAVHGLSDMANSGQFRRETFNRFNQQDVFRITQGAAENGLLSGTSSPQGVTSRVRDIAKSVSAFMELAREPDIQRAIQTMGALRNSGLNLQETLSAVQAGRTFARMAGTSFQGLSEIGGALGSQMYQSMGLTQGLGVRVGMGAYAQGASSVSQGILSPQVASLVGGREGLAMLNSTYSASQLQLPMVAMGLMGGRGGLDASALSNYLRGGTDVFGMTSRGSGVLGGITGRMGVGGLGMAVGMQPMLQDTIGRLVEGQGPFARRNIEDRSIMNLMRQMGMNGAEGFMTAAQMSGMQGTAALARVNELQSGRYWETQQDQLRTDFREARANAERERRVRSPRVLDTFLRNTGLGDFTARAGEAIHHDLVNLNRFYQGSETHDVDGSPTTDSGRRRLEAMIRSESFRRALDPSAAGGRGLPGGVAGVGYGTNLAWAGGSRGALATLDGFFMGNQGFRNRAAQDYAAGGAYATNMLGATSAEQRRAMGRVGETFGSMAALGEYTQAASDLAQNANSAGRVFAGAITGGMFGSRAIAGSSLQRAFRDTMRRQGLSDAEINRRWEREGGTIAAQHAQMRRAYGETDAEREAWETTGEAASRFSQSVPVMRQHREAANASYQQLLGDTGSEGQAAFRTITDEIEGLGPEGSRRNQTSRRLATGLVLAQINGRGGGEDARRATVATVNRLREEARAGLSAEDISTVIDQSAGISRRHQDTEGALTAARGFVSRGGGLDAIGATDEARLRDLASRRVLSGFGQMGREGGTLGRVFGGLTESNFSEARLRERINDLSAADIRALRQTRGQEGVVAAIERVRSGDARGGLSDLYSRAGNVGRDTLALEGEYDREQGGGLGGRFRRGIDAYNEWRGNRSSTYDDARARWVQEQLRATSPEAREARARRNESLDAQGAVQGAGIGRAGDALLEASREISEAARNLREVSQSNSITALVGRVL